MIHMKNAAIKWSRERAGLYSAKVERADLGLTLNLMVELGDEENRLDPEDFGWWAWSYECDREFYNDGFSYRTKRDAVAAALRFAEECRLDERWGLVTG